MVDVSELAASLNYAHSVGVIIRAVSWESLKVLQRLHSSGKLFAVCPDTQVVCKHIRVAQWIYEHVTSVQIVVG